MIKNITCISCPVGCSLTVTLEDGAVVKVEGQGCPRGEVYAKKECVNPTRIFTSSVPVAGGFWEMVSVKTVSDVPKSSLMACAQSLKGIQLTAPVQIGDVVVANAAGTGVNIIATRAVEAIR
jgi:CxxC motif-containing protein